MNDLPIIMTILVAQKINENGKKYLIPTFFQYSDDLRRENNDDNIKRRNELISKAFPLHGLKSLKDKKIKLKKNNIKNTYENYENFISKVKKEENKDQNKNKDQKPDFGNDLFNIDIDYKKFFKLNNIFTIIFENCLFSYFSNPRIKEKDIEETIINLMSFENRTYIIDMKTLNEIIYKNKSMSDTSSLLQLINSKNNNYQMRDNDYTQDVKEYLLKLAKFSSKFVDIFKCFKNNKITIYFNNLKERKEFYCLLCIYRVLKNDKNYDKFTLNKEPKNEIKIPNSKELRKAIEDYFLKEKNENNEEICSIFNYYYTSEEEKNLFGDYGKEKEKINFEGNEFEIKYEYNIEDHWNFIYE